MALDIFDGLAEGYRQGIFTTPTTFYFSIDDAKKTITLGEDRCSIEEGKATAEADCVLKTSAEMLDRIWNGGYRPSAMDFMAGKIKSNSPQLLLKFLEAFGK